MGAFFIRSSAVLGAMVFVFLSSGLAETLETRTETQPVQVSVFSGKPVPRFESLRYSAVHGRQGPSLDHPILWRYEKEGLPMLIVRETNGWRRVRDIDGDEVWMQARMLSPARTVTTLEDLTLYKQADDTSRAKATLREGVIAELAECEGRWCQISVGRIDGWVEASGLWGTGTEAGGL